MKQIVTLQEKLRNKDYQLEFGIIFHNEVLWNDRRIRKIHGLPLTKLMCNRTFKRNCDPGKNPRYLCVFDRMSTMEVVVPSKLFKDDEEMIKCCRATIYENAHILKTTSYMVNNIIMKSTIIECSGVYDNFYGIPYELGAKHDIL